MRETVSLSFASVVKISYVFITKDEHTFFYVRRITFRPHSAKIALYSDCGKFSAIFFDSICRSTDIKAVVHHYIHGSV